MYCKEKSFPILFIYVYWLIDYYQNVNFQIPFHKVCTDFHGYQKLYENSCFPTDLPNRNVAILLNLQQFDRLDMILQFFFNLHFSDYKWSFMYFPMWSTFSYLLFKLCFLSISKLLILFTTQSLPVHMLSTTMFFNYRILLYFNAWEEYIPSWAFFSPQCFPIFSCKFALLHNLFSSTKNNLFIFLEGDCVKFMLT